MLKSDLMEKYFEEDITTFIETGTHTGLTVNEALKFGKFKKIISIEIDRYFYNKTVNLFVDHSNVTLLNGDSCEKMSEILDSLDEKSMFWLDAHYNSNDSRRKECPIINELKQIANHHIKDHVILIDDMRYMLPQYNKVTKEQIVELVMSVNPFYEISYEYNNQTEDDILVAVLRKI
jgi:hypothetical protein